MQATTLEMQVRADGAVGWRGRRQRLVRVLARCGTVLRRHAARWSACEDRRYLGAAHSLAELERRQRRLERDGTPLGGFFLP